MPKILIGKRLILPLVLLFGLCLGLAGDGLSQREDFDDQRELRQEIVLLNLINGLHLSEEQMGFLTRKAREAQNIREAFIEEYHRHSDTSSQSLEGLREELIDDKGYVSDEVSRELHHANIEMVKLRSEYQNDIDRIVEDVKGVLRKAQLYIIEEFKPCLVPPKGPLRVGQAGDAAVGVKHLERIRKIPDNRYSLKKYELTDRILERILLHKPRDIEIDKESARDKILSIFDEARQLSGVDFKLKKEELAKELRDNIIPKSKTIDIDIKIERFLLASTVIPILEQRLEEK